jgi:hypothetical protein
MTCRIGEKRTDIYENIQTGVKRTGVKRTDSYEKYIQPGVNRTGSKVDEEQESSEENRRQGG